MATPEKTHFLLGGHKVCVNVVAANTQMASHAQYRDIKLSRWETEFRPKVDNLCHNVMQMKIAAIAEGASPDNSPWQDTAVASAWKDLQKGCEVSDGKAFVKTIFCLENLELKALQDSRSSFTLTITLTGSLTAKGTISTETGPQVKLAQVTYSTSVSMARPARQEGRDGTPDSTLGGDSDNAGTSTQRSQHRISITGSDAASVNGSDGGCTGGSITGSIANTGAGVSMSNASSALKASMSKK
jgi:hypothetical protein